MQEAVASEVALFFFFFADIAVFYAFKIESCFPSILDSRPFHSPFVEKGLQLCRVKVEHARRSVAAAAPKRFEVARSKAKEYSSVVDLES